jgi:hypothetical protein
MGNKLAVVLSASALVVALLGSTTAGRAALDAVIPVPLAKRAYLADTARNSIKLNNIKADRTPTPGDAGAARREREAAGIGRRGGAEGRQGRERQVGGQVLGLRQVERFLGAHPFEW